MAEQQVTAFYLNNNPVMPILTGVLTISENHTGENNIAEQTLEDGSKLNDHIIVTPKRLTLNFYCSNLDDAEGNSRGSKATTAWWILDNMRVNRWVFDVNTTHELYQNVTIESVNAIHTAPITGELTFTVNLKQLNFASPYVFQNNLSQMGGEV